MYSLDCVYGDCVHVVFLSVFFFFKQKTAYEMRISDWSSDVCSSDLKAPCSANVSMMSSESDSARPRASRKDVEKKMSRKGQDVNIALRRAYESAVDETIPQSMLELLDKLNCAPPPPPIDIERKSVMQWKKVSVR